MHADVRRSATVVMLLQIVASLFLFTAVFADQKPVLQGKIHDAEGNALRGASVFIYDSPDTKRPVDLVSAQTGDDGRFRMVVPPGRYWAVARLKAEGRFGLGPLMPGDKFSGEPQEIEIAHGEERTIDFTLLDIMEYARQKQKIRADCIKIKGRLVDEHGRPVPMAYAVANRDERHPDVPDYLSAWTDEDGQYTLYLPRGNYYVGYATAFPPGKRYATDRVVAADADILNVDLVVRTEGL